MDSQDKDESKIRRREITLARRLGEALDQSNPSSAENCPDAEVIAAYAEQALGPAESAQCEGHFATCSRCRKILRVLAASADTPLAEKEVAQLGEPVSAGRAPVEIAGKSPGRARPRLVDWRMRWLAPALGVAAALAVWFAMRPPWRATDRGTSATLVAQAPKEEVPLSPAPAEVDRFSKVAPPQDQKAQPTSPPDRFTANTPSLKSPAGALAERREEAGNAIKKVAPSSDLAESALQKEEKFGNPPVNLEALPQASPAPPPPPRAKTAMEAPASAPLPQARAQADAAATPAPEVPRSASQSVTVTESAPQVGTTNGTLGGTIQQGSSKDLPLNGRDYQALIKLRPAPEFLASLKAPSGSTLWRAGKGGIIERSTGAGKIWVSQASPSQEDWLAGTAVSDTVCWLVGRNGAIARTVDGLHWERISPPVQAAGTDAKLPDWISITTRDAQTATITASDGRKFATADGGKTWQLQ
jgi:hypothetical protein